MLCKYCKRKATIFNLDTDTDVVHSTCYKHRLNDYANIPFRSMDLLNLYLLKLSL